MSSRRKFLTENKLREIVKKWNDDDCSDDDDEDSDDRSSSDGDPFCSDSGKYLSVVISITYIFIRRISHNLFSKCLDCSKCSELDNSTNSVQSAPLAISRTRNTSLRNVIVSSNANLSNVIESHKASPQAVASTSSSSQLAIEEPIVDIPISQASPQLICSDEDDSQSCHGRSCGRIWSCGCGRGCGNSVCPDTSLSIPSNIEGANLTDVQSVDHNHENKNQVFLLILYQLKMTFLTIQVLIFPF